MTIWCWIEMHPALAAWVQAVGAILALGVAIGVPALAARSQDRHRKEMALALGRMAVRAMEVTATFAGVPQAPGLTGENLIDESRELSLEILRARIAAFPVERLPQAAGSSLLRIAALTRNATGLSELIQNGGPNGSSVVGDFGNVVEQARVRLKELEAAVGLGRS